MAVQLLKSSSLPSHQICKYCLEHHHTLLSQWTVIVTSQTRYATGFVQGVQKREAKKHNVDKFIGDNATKTKTVYAWGLAETGALGISSYLRPGGKNRGHGFVNKINRPARVKFFDVKRLKPLDVACGYGFSLFHVKLKNKKLLLGTGINADSQLGFHESPKGSGRILDQLIEPGNIRLPTENPDNLDIVSMSCGRAHSVVVVRDQGVFSLGNNASGQCGRPIVEGEDYSKNQLVNTLTDIPENIVKVVCGQDHTLFLTESGQVWSCGLGADGQTGLGHYKVTGHPRQVKGDIQGEKIVSLGGKADCVLAVSESGDVFGWGNSEYGQLASVTSDIQLNSPRSLNPGLNSTFGKVVKAVAGGSLCALLNEQGQVYVWGYGILGKGPALDSSQSPSLIPPPIFGQSELSPDTKVVDIECGLTYVVAKTDKGDLFSWGRNNHGCLGLHQQKNQFFPLRISVPAEVDKFSCGVDHVMSICRNFT